MAITNLFQSHLRNDSDSKHPFLLPIWITISSLYHWLCGGEESRQEKRGLLILIQLCPFSEIPYDLKQDPHDHFLDHLSPHLPHLSLSASHCFHLFTHSLLVFRGKLLTVRNQAFSTQTSPSHCTIHLLSHLRHNFWMPARRQGCLLGYAL